MKKIKVSETQFKKLFKKSPSKEITNQYKKETKGLGIKIETHPAMMGSYKPQSEKENIRTFKSMNEAIRELDEKEFSKEVINVIDDISTNQLDIYGLSTFWKKNGISKKELLLAMEKANIVIKDEDKVKTNKKDIEKKVKELYTHFKYERKKEQKTKEGYLMFGNDMELTEDGKQKKFKVIHFNDRQSIAILKDVSENTYIFNYYNIPQENFAEYADLKKIYVGKDEDGFPMYEYPEWEMNEFVIENYVNKNVDKLNYGVGVNDFNLGVDIAMIDNELKTELINTFTSDNKLKDVLSKIGETTTAASSGAYVGTVGMSSPISKLGVVSKEVDEHCGCPHEEIEETTVAGSSAEGGSSGPYVTPQIWAKNPKSHIPAKKTQYKGGYFVKIKEKCKKFPYCNQGIDAIELKKTKDSAI